MAKKTSLTKITSGMHVASFQNATIGGLGVIVLMEWWGSGSNPVACVMLWVSAGIGLIVGSVLMIRRCNQWMRSYAERRGAVPNSYGLEYQIIPFGDVLAFFIGLATLVLIAGIYLLLATEMRKWGIVLCAGIALLVALVSAVMHRQFVKRIEDALDSDENGWKTFHQWSVDTFKEIL